VSARVERVRRMMTTDKRLAVLYLMYIPWQWVRQRPQYMAEALRDRGYRVTVVSPLLWRKKVLVGGGAFDGPQAHYRFLPFRFKSGIVYTLNRFLMRCCFASILQRNPHAILWVPFPEMMDYLPRRLNGIVVYDCMDDALAFDQLAPIRERLCGLEQGLVARADVVLTSSVDLATKLANRYGTSENVHVVHNAFGGPRLPQATAAPGTNDACFIGYIGNMDTLDADAIARSLEELPFIHYDFIGPPGRRPFLRNHPRVRYLGAVVHDALAVSVQGDLCLILPYTMTERVRSADSMKLYDYVNLGKPIVSVWYAEIARFEPFVEFYRTTGELVEVLKRVSSEGYSRKYTETQRLQFLAENSWDKRAETVRSILQSLSSDGRCS
jgi:teichuronic acid biosynthesis glycosyltransferase TuaH